ncbi:MAG TPA: peptidoglycan DD-metalloendopeptidase family protein [Allosphingosinicella sp.]|nr:peptidoglycan DD-metalloendopeptidase family protein [Allosphingosinicella sp.]
MEWKANRLPSLQGRGWGWVRRRRPKHRVSEKPRFARLPTPHPSLPGRGILLLLAALLAGDLAVAQAPGGPTLAEARQEAAEARRRSELLEGEARRATGEAERANAAAAALASRIEAAEADITAAQARIALVERLSAEQRARLAASQGSLIRLTAALQTMARRPPALALIQPGSLDEVVHVRALLASSLPAIRARTAGVRSEMARGEALRRQARDAVLQLGASRRDLQQRRVALARFEQDQRRRSASLMQSALHESDRALAFGEEARDLAALAGTRAFQAQLARRLAELPGPELRPGDPPARRRPPYYLLPVEGRLLTGTGEISDAGVHARGLTFAARAGAQAIAPRSGRIAYAAPYRGYGEVVIIDHGGGWTTTLTNLAGLAVRRGDQVRARQPLGRTGAGEVTVELRKDGRPFPITLLL